MATATQTEEGEDRAFMRSVTWCWEDFMLRHPGFVWRGEYRWFRSPNVVPLERYRPPGWRWGDARSR